MSYLSSLLQGTCFTEFSKHRVPLARYATEYLAQNVRQAGKDAGRIDLLTMKHFQFEKGAYVNWIRLCDADTP